MAGAKGGEWTHKIYFVPDADKTIGKTYLIGNDELIDKLGTLVDPGEAIIKIYAYKTPLSTMQLTSFTMYHAFIVFKTDKWWWSIEKDGEGIVIQRSKSLSAVKCKQRQKSRGSRISLVKEDKGRVSVEDLLNWLYEKNELNHCYHLLFSNCKTFAKGVFGHVARKEYLFWYDGAFS